jgi:anti-anti-sigma regulatory factor
MLRIEFDHSETRSVTVRLQGRLVGAYAEDARVTLARCQVPQFIAVDLSEVTFVDALGEQVLLWLGRLGAKFVAANVYTRSMCERLQLEISEQQPGSNTQVLA